MKLNIKKRASLIWLRKRCVRILKAFDKESLENKVASTVWDKQLKRNFCSLMRNWKDTLTVRLIPSKDLICKNTN